MQIKKHLSFSGLRKVVSETFNTVKDCRQVSKVDISIHDAVLSGLACMYFQDPSLLQFQKRLEESHHKNNLRSLFNVQVIPKETQMRDIIDKVESENFASIFKDYYQRLQRGKHLEQFQIFPSMYYFPIDGSQFFGSEDVRCKQCLTKEHNGGKRYEHHVLQGGIMHPDCRHIIPFMPEQIVNSDGQAKQDCEMNAAKRFLKKLKQSFPQLGLLIGGDALFSKQPIIEDVRKHDMHYLFVAKPTDHKYMMEWLGVYDKLHSKEVVDKDGRHYHCEWMNKVPLNSSERVVEVNFLRCTISKKSGAKETAYTNSWVTDIEITGDNVITLARAGRCRWKSENECFNVMKNHGYCMEHNYGHGQENLAFNFYLLTLLAFFMHQIFELTDQLYKACREKLGSKKNLWENLRAYIKLIVFDSWELLLQFALKPSSYRLVLDTT